MTEPGTDRSDVDRLQKARDAMYRDHILDVAEEVFAELGYDGAQVKRVAARAQISLSTLYGHFGTKMALYSAIHARRLDALMERLQSVGRDSAGPLRWMLAGIEGYIGFHMEHPTYLRMHLREGNAWSEVEGLYSDAQRETWRRGLERMAATLEIGIEVGVFVRDDAMVAARTTNAMHQVALSKWVEDGMVESQSTLIARLHRQYIRAFGVPERIVELLALHGGSET